MYGSHLANSFRVEFNALLPLYIAEANNQQLHGGKAGHKGQLFILLYMNKINSTVRDAQETFNLAKSSIDELLERGNCVLISAVETYFQGMFPTRDERDFLKTLLPAWLQESGAFFVWILRKLLVYILFLKRPVVNIMIYTKVLVLNYLFSVIYWEMFFILKFKITMVMATMAFNM